MSATPPASPSPPFVRRARPADAADFARIMGHPEVYPSLMQLPLADEDMWRARIEDGSAPGRHDLRVVAEVEGQVIASAGLHPALPLRRRHCATLGISVLPEHQGRGVGRALMQTMCDYADGWAQLLRLELTVFTDNERAIALYRSVGFRVEGTHRGFALRHGAYADVHAMARLHPHPPALAWPHA